MFKLFRRPKELPIDREYFLSLLSGTEGGLATTTAIVVGLSLSNSTQTTIITSALVAFCVQAFNGSIGHFSSEHTNDEIDDTHERDGYAKPAKDALFYFSSHIATSLLVLTPVITIEDQMMALGVSVSIAVVLLFAMGWYKGNVVKTNRLKDGLEMVMFGLLVIAVGAISGLLLKN